MITMITMITHLQERAKENINNYNGPKSQLLVAEQVQK